MFRHFSVPPNKQGNRGRVGAVRASKERSDSNLTERCGAKTSKESFRWPQVGGAVTEQAHSGNALAEDDADWNEDGSSAGRIGDSDFEARAFGILIAAAEADATLG